MAKTYKRILEFKRKYPDTLTFRLRLHCDVIDKHLNPDEEILYAFAGQKNDNFWEIFNTCVVVITNKRIMIGTKRVLWGYFFSSITPDMFNDIEVNSSLIWGNVVIDTIKEVVTISNISKRALPEVETEISSYMMEAKKLYPDRSDEKRKNEKK